MRRALALALLACAVSCAPRPPSPAWVAAEMRPEFEDGNPYVVAQRIRIDAPRDSVWRMLSRSASARRWSVIVHHIDVLSGRDGVVGTVRRCYLCPKGTFDERVVALEPPSYRKLACIATADLEGAMRNIPGNFAYQNFDSLDANTTELQLTITYELIYGPLNGLVDACYARPRLGQVLAKNLVNMKALVENGERYQRVHAFEGGEARCPEWPSPTASGSEGIPSR